jgi:hypothetical protein
MGDGKHPERMRVGFESLINKASPESYLDGLQEYGLLSTVPSGAPKEGRPTLNVWPAGRYLIAVARRAAQDEHLAQVVIARIRDVTAEADNPEVLNNYQIWRDCAEIAGLLPPSVIKPEDIALIGKWLESPFDTSLVAIELSKGLIPALLRSGNEPSRGLLVQVIELLTRVGVVSPEEKHRAIRSVVDDYWLGEILKRHATPLGELCGEPILNLLESRVVEVFAGSTPSWLLRPAIEDHPQNQRGERLLHVFVSALRDAAEGGARSPDAFRKTVSSFLSSKSEVVFRIGMHLARTQFWLSQDILEKTFNKDWFTGGAKHELFLLLKEKFASFKEPFRGMILGVVRELPVKEPARREQYWMKVLALSGDGNAKERLGELDDLLGPIPYDIREGLWSYTESSWGWGPSPYSPAALKSLADRDELVEVINGFEPDNSWNGPSVYSLVKALEEGIVESPPSFLHLHQRFLKAKPAFQYAFLSGFEHAWENGRGKGPPQLDTQAWTTILDFARSVIERTDVNKSDDASERLTPQASWLPGVIANLVEEGVKQDDYAFDVALLPKAKDLLSSLFAEVAVRERDDVDDDAVTTAINTPRGKIIEAMLSLALRAKRTAQPAELVDGILSNFDVALREKSDLETITLLVPALAQLNYLSADWWRAHGESLFKLGDKARLSWALSGLAHAPHGRWIDSFLKERGVYVAACRIRNELGNAWEALLSRITLAYLVGDGRLDDPHWAILLAERDYESLRRATWFLWTQRDQPLTEERLDHVVDFWAAMDQIADEASPEGRSLLGSVGAHLTWALRSDHPKAEQLLTRSAKYLKPTHHEFEFVDELKRIAGSNPDLATRALVALLSGDDIPVIDYEDRYLTLLQILLDADQIEGVVKATDRLRGIASIKNFYEQQIQGRTKG